MYEVITLDSGAGCNVWPRGRSGGNSTLTPKKPGIGMVVANGTKIEHYGQRKVQFKGIQPDEASAFHRRT